MGIALAVLLAAASPTPSKGVKATFIGNTAVYLTDGRVALVTDFPYESGYSGYMRWSGDPLPKGPRPLCLVTHSHRDHFLPALAAETCGRVLGPRDVEEATRVPALGMEPEVHWEGITIRPQATPHAGLEHYSYVVEWNGSRLFFTGDTEDPAALLAARNLDAAFVSPWLLRSVRQRGVRIDARTVIVYHHRDGETPPRVQGRIVPTQGQTIEIKAAP